MSRGDFGSGGGYSTNNFDVGFSSQPSGGYSGARNGDSEYIRLSNTVTKNIDNFTRKIASIQSMVKQIGTNQDVPELFERLQSEQKSAGLIAKETTTYLKQLSHLETSNPNEVRQRKIQQEKLQDNFSNALHNFQKIQRVAAERERATVQRARAKSMEQGFGFPSPNDTDRINERGPQLQVQAEAELDIEMIVEREEALKRLESDIVDVNEIFKELAVIVHDQGDMIDSIEAHIDTTVTHVEQGNVQLEKAKTYQKAARKKMCCILVVLLVAAGALGLIIWLATK